jgi:Tfp pilus assembly protein PilE
MKAFTLIEAIIYVALLSILTLTAMQALYAIESSARSDAGAYAALEERLFVMQKADYDSSN